MFGFNGIFNRKPRQFEYKPLYYDPEKEARNQRRRELGLDVPDDAQTESKPGDKIRQRMGSQRIMMSEQARKRQSATIRYLLLIVVLVGLMIWLILSLR